MKLLQRCLLAFALMLGHPAISSALPQHWHECGGFGTETQGGLAGDVYKVTNLNSSGPGSLRDAVSESNRLVVFEVGGVIDMEGERLGIASDVTIAGQTAPYPGISVIKSNVGANGSNIVVSHINVHLGSKVGRHYDAFNVRGSDIVLNHIAVYWGLDETLPIARSSDVTVYKCMIAEGLQFTGHGDGEHSKGLHIQEGNQRVSVIGSLGAHNALRNPRIDGGEAFLANYVLYNWGPGWDHVGPKVSSDDELPGCTECFNYGVSAHMDANVTLVGSVALWGHESRGEYFLSGHYGRSANGYLKDNIIKDRDGNDLQMTDPAITLLDSPAIWPEGMEPLPAEKAVYEVLRTVGPHPGHRNPHNARLVKSVADGTGEIIDSEEEVGGYPDYPETSRSIQVPEGVEARRAWLDSLEDDVAVDTGLDLSRLYGLVGSPASDQYAQQISTTASGMKCMLIGAPDGAENAEFEQYIIPRLEAWGYHVDRRLSSELPDLKAGDYEPYDFIFLSETTHSSNMSPLKNIPRPMVCSDGWAVKESALAFGVGEPCGILEPSQPIVLLDSAKNHPLAAGFAPGTVLEFATVEDEPQPALLVWGKPTIPVIPIAGVESDPTQLAIYGIEEGTTNATGDTIPHRVVVLGPHAWGYDDLTEPGEQLFKAAINWVLETGEGNQ